MLSLTQAALDDLDSATDGLDVSGWIISPYLDQGSITDFCRVARNLARYRAATDEVRETGLDRANNELARIFARATLHYDRQVGLVGLFMNLPVIGRFSHLIEMAMIERYRINLPAALYMSVPLIEGIILALSGPDWTPRRFGKEKTQGLVPSPSLGTNERRLFGILHRQLTTFVEKVYGDTRSDSGLGVGNFNRHYMLHTLGNVPIFFPGNVARAFMAIEILAALEQLNVQGSLSLPDPSTLPRVQGVTRERYYEECMRQEGLGSVNLLRADFLSHHAHFDIDAFYGDVPGRRRRASGSSPTPAAPPTATPSRSAAPAPPAHSS